MTDLGSEAQLPVGQGWGWGWGLLHTSAVTVRNGGKVRGQRGHAEGLLLGIWMVAEDQQISQLVTICLLLKAGRQDNWNGGLCRD